MLNLVDDDLQKKLNDPNRLAILRLSGLLDPVPDATFDRLTRLGANIADAPVALVTFSQDGQPVCKSLCTLGEGWASQKSSHALCRQVWFSGKPLIVTDARVHQEA